MMHRLLPALLLLGVVACSSSSPTATETTVEQAPISDGAWAVLTVTYSNESAGTSELYRVSCGAESSFFEGDIAGIGADKACADLADPDVVTLLVTPMDQQDRMCTQIYGGDDRAILSGTIDGRGVEVVLDRSDGCGIDDWNRLAGGLVPQPFGTAD